MATASPSLSASRLSARLVEHVALGSELVQVKGTLTGNARRSSPALKAQLPRAVVVSMAPVRSLPLIRVTMVSSYERGVESGAPPSIIN